MALAEPSLKVVPVLVEGAQMPDENDLPEDLQRLARLQAIELSENRWDYDMQRLAAVLAQAGVDPPAAARWPHWLGGLVAGLILVAALVATLGQRARDSGAMLYCNVDVGDVRLGGRALRALERRVLLLAGDMAEEEPSDEAGDEAAAAQELGQTERCEGERRDRAAVVVEAAGVAGTVSDSGLKSSISSVAAGASPSRAVLCRAAVRFAICCGVLLGSP